MEAKLCTCTYTCLSMLKLKIVMDKERVRGCKIVLEFMESWILFIKHFSNVKEQVHIEGLTVYIDPYIFIY